MQLITLSTLATASIGQILAKILIPHGRLIKLLISFLVSVTVKHHPWYGDSIVTGSFTPDPAQHGTVCHGAARRHIAMQCIWKI